MIARIVRGTPSETDGTSDVETVPVISTGGRTRLRGTDLVSVPQICAEHTVCDVPADEARVSHADCVELDELIDIVAKAQDPDGYICTQIQLNPGKER